MKTWLAGLTVFAALTAAAQAEIVAGTVVERATNQPVANASVTVTLASGAQPVHAKTDAGGRFTIETAGAPASVSVQRGSFFEPYTMTLAALAPSVMADLRIALDGRLVIIERLTTRSVCGAFQPRQLWDHYDLVPGGCGAPKS